jgi:FkbM family methyltransferase
MLTFDEKGVPEDKKAIYDRLMSGARMPVYVVGRNKYAERVSKLLTVQAFVDDFTAEPSYMGKPVVRMRELPPECLVVSCVTGWLPLTTLDRLHAAGVRHVIDYFMLTRLGPQTFAPVDYCAGNRQDILENQTRYQWVHDHLADETSRQHFTKVVRFRLTLDLEYMRGFSKQIDRQYFEDFFHLPEKAVFVDGGGYDGQTTKQFAARHPSYGRIYYFEPVPAMMEVSRRSLIGLRDVRMVQKGLFDRNTVLRFCAAEGSASHLSSTGETEIEVVRLDDEVQEPVTFLKLDVEGAEYEALAGATEHIRSETPLLAVCIYHNQKDFWRIPLRVLEINDRYKLCVRHYTEGTVETVMFFVPASQYKQ